MISSRDIQLNVARAYIAHVKDLFPTPTYESNKFLSILKIYEWQMLRYQQKKQALWEDLATLKTGVRESEIFLQNVLGDDRDDIAREMADLVCSIILEFTKEIVETEALYPELKYIFDRERLAYRKMKNEAERE